MNPELVLLEHGIPRMEPLEVELRGALAREAQRAWRHVPLAERRRLMLRVRELLLGNQESLARLISDEVGKPEFEAYSMEILPCAQLIRHFSRKFEPWLRPRRFTLSGLIHKRSEVTREPLGVVGVISPWNFPLSIPMGHIVPALLAGNAVVFKPSEWATRTGLRLGQLFMEAGFPENLLQVVTGDGATGAALVGAGIDKVFFTGSAASGRKIAESAGKRLIPSVLEMGGKDAMIVCADAPLERAIHGAVWGAFCNAGQACASVERVYVVASIADQFISGVLEETKKLRCRSAAGGEYDIGPLIHAGQQSIVREHVEEAIQKGARCLCGGKPLPAPSTGFEPTVLTHVNGGMRIIQEETFGPVMPIQVVASEEEALREANQSRFGLMGSIWTRDTQRGLAMARWLEAGMVLINDVMYTHGVSETPWTGIKQSGLGVSHGPEGFLEFIRYKHTNWDRFLLSKNFWWFPYTAGRLRRLRKLGRWMS